MRRSSNGSETSVSRQPRLPHAACAVRIDDNVADLTGRERRACVEAVSTRSAPTPSSTRRIRLVAGCSPNVSSASAGVGVVDGANREIELRRQVCGEQEAGPRYRDDHNRRRFRAGDADAEERPLGDEDTYTRTTRLAAARPVLPLRSAVRRTTTLPARLMTAPTKVRLGEIEAQNVAAVGVDVDERRRLADTARRAQSRFHDAVVHQVATDDTDARVSPVTLRESARERERGSLCSVRSRWLRFARPASSGVAINSFV